jgi:hypothetical protein
MSTGWARTSTAVAHMAGWRGTGRPSLTRALCGRKSGSQTVAAHGRRTTGQLAAAVTADGRGRALRQAHHQRGARPHQAVLGAHGAVLGAPLGGQRRRGVGQDEAQHLNGLWGHGAGVGWAVWVGGWQTHACRWECGGAGVLLGRHGGPEMRGERRQADARTGGRWAGSIYKGSRAHEGAASSPPCPGPSPRRTSRPTAAPAPPGWRGPAAGSTSSARRRGSAPAPRTACAAEGAELEPSARLPARKETQWSCPARCPC